MFGIWNSSATAKERGRRSFIYLHHAKNRASKGNWGNTQREELHTLLSSNKVNFRNRKRVASLPVSSVQRIHQRSATVETAKQMLLSVWKTAFLNTNKELVKTVCNIFLLSTIFRHRSYPFVLLQPPVQQCQTYLPSRMTLLVKPKRISPTKTILQPYWRPPTSRRLLWCQWSVRMGEMGLSCRKWKRVRISRWDGWRCLLVLKISTCATRKMEMSISILLLVAALWARVPRLLSHAYWNLIRHSERISAALPVVTVEALADQVVWVAVGWNPIGVVVTIIWQQVLLVPVGGKHLSRETPCWGIQPPRQDPWEEWPA